MTASRRKIDYGKRALSSEGDDKDTSAEDENEEPGGEATFKEKAEHKQQDPGGTKTEKKLTLKKRRKQSAALLLQDEKRRLIDSPCQNKKEPQHREGKEDQNEQSDILEARSTEKKKCTKVGSKRKPADSGSGLGMGLDSEDVKRGKFPTTYI